MVLVTVNGVKRLIAPGSDWPVASGDQAKWGIPSVLVALLMAQVGAIFWFSAIASLLYGSDPIPSADSRPIWTLLVFNAGLWLAYFFGPIIVKRYSESGPLLDFNLGITLREAAVAIALGVGTQLAVLPALYWVLLRFVSGDPSESAIALTDRVDGTLDLALVSFAVVIVAPIVEEWFYRGFVFSTLARRIGVLGAASVSSALFALVHLEAILLPGLFVLALLLCWITVRSAKIGPAILAHMAFNATTVVQLLVL